MFTFFAALAVVGITYILGSFLVGHALGGEGEHGEVEGGHDGHDCAAEHGGQASGAGSLPLLGPNSIAFLLIGLGIGGSIGVETLRWAGAALAGAALVPGLTAWLAAAALMRKMAELGRGGRAVRADRFRGEEAEVIVSIPEGGIGEITFVSQGEIHSGAARAQDGGALAAGRKVMVVRMVDDGSFVVGPSLEEALGLGHNLAGEDSPTPSARRPAARDPEGTAR